MYGYRKIIGDAMTLKRIKMDIQAGDIPPVYLWYGEDRFSIIEALKALKQVFLEEDSSGSGIEHFSGKEVTAGRICESANTASFFSRRLVVVDDIPFFSQTKTKHGTGEEAQEEKADLTDPAHNDDISELLNYCEQPNPSACLVLISDKANKGRKLYKAIASNGKAVEFSYPGSRQEWQEWVLREVRSRGRNIDFSTASFLVEWSGHHPGILVQELDKLTLYLGKKYEISKEDIKRVCIPLVETTVFAMLDAVSSGKSAEALQRLGEVMSQEHYLKVHTMIVRQIRLLLAASMVRKQGGTLKRFMEVTGIRTGFEGNKVFGQAARFSPEILACHLEECFRTDMALKSSAGSPRLLLEIMIIRLCRNEKTGS